jgi:hypothetical protein
MEVRIDRMRVRAYWLGEHQTPLHLALWVEIDRDGDSPFVTSKRAWPKRVDDRFSK